MKTLFIALATVLSAAGASEPGSTLRYGGGKEFHTVLQDAQLLGELPVPGNEPILLFSGRLPNVSCCDPETSVFHQSASSAPSMWNSMDWRYPGNYYASESGRLVARVRMFVGRCLDSREAAVWFVEKLDDSSPEVESVWQTRAIVGFVLYQEKLGGMYAEQHLTEKMPDIAVARAAVSKGTCHEIPPRPEIYRTAAAYIAAPHPRFRTDCSSPAPDPRDVPLAPGSPGRPVSYHDEGTNIVFHVESDGRHLAATRAGAPLWVRDPFVDKNLCPYRNQRPIIVRFGPISGVREAEIVKAWKREGPFVEIFFDSSQFGVVDTKTGDFFFEGQN